jgi:DNA primase small subunit
MGGYKGKFARRIIKMLNDPASAALISPKLKNAENVKRLICGIEKGNWSAVQIPHAVEQFRKIFLQTSLRLTNQVETDANVTIDTSKILRLPDSIHGGSGMLAKSIPPSKKLCEFSPLIDALAFSMKKTQRVRTLRKIPSQEFGAQTFDEIACAKEIELPEAYAIYLVCKKTAVPII